MTTFTRRTLLKLLGASAGAGLLAPLTRSLLSAQENGGPMPRRFVILMTGNGIEPHNFMSDPLKSALQSRPDPDSTFVATAADASLASASALAALAGQRGEFDLTPHATVLLNLSSQVTGGSHTTLYKALAASRTRRQTIDSWLEDHVATDAQTFSALRIGSQGAGLHYNACQKSPTRQLPVLGNFAKAYDHVFGSLLGSKGFEERGHLLDFALEDVRQAEREFVGSSQERQKLTNYIASLEEMEATRQRIITQADKLQDTQMRYGLRAEDITGWNDTAPLAQLDYQFELATAALLGELTRVAMITMRVGNDFNATTYATLKPLFGDALEGDGAIPRRHIVCHEAGAKPEYQRVLDAVIARQVELLARLARRLAATPEGDGTMLDHTVIVFMSDNGSTHHSDARHWPMLLLGGKALGLATGGQAISFRASGGEEERVRVANLFNTLGHLAGQDLNEFGGEHDALRRERGGPISELLS